MLDILPYRVRKTNPIARLLTKQWRCVEALIISLENAIGTKGGSELLPANRSRRPEGTSSRNVQSTEHNLARVEAGAVP